MSKRATSLGLAGFFIAGPFLVATPVRDLRDFLSADTWRPVQAKVISATERKARYTNARSDQTELEVRYSYTYDGLPRENTSYTHVGAMSAGDVVIVRVSPRDPRRALFNPKSDLFFELLTWWGAIAFGLFALGYALLARPAEDE